MTVRLLGIIKTEQGIRLFLNTSKWTHIFTLILVFILINPPLYSQDETEPNVTQQIWLDYNLSYPLPKNFNLYVSTGAKTVFPNVWYKVFLNPEVSYKIPKFMLKKLMYNEQVYFGIDFYYAYWINATNTFEIAPYQGYSLSWPNRKRIAIKHNFQLRQRIQWSTFDLSSSFGIQMSYEATLTLKFHGDLWKYGKGFYMPVSVRFWWNLLEANLFNDVVRITPGIGYQISPKWKVAFKLGYNYTRNTVTEGFNTNNIIFQFRVYHTLFKKD